MKSAVGLDAWRKGTADIMNNPIYNQNVNKHRRLKFGALAVGLTVAVVALVVIVNAVFSVLATKFMWYVDMTKEQIYGITQQSLDLLDSYRSTEEFQIDIVFCSYEDALRAEYSTNLVHNLAKQYEEEFDFINVKYIDIINHPEAVDQYLATSVSRPKTTSVIISNGTQSRLYTINSFYTFDSDSGNVFAFNGEYKITAAILQLAGDNPIAYFVTGHGEQTEGTVMWSLFEDAGFDVRKIDLSKETPDDAAKVMVINNPKFDFLGGNDSVNEIKKVDEFLDNNFGGLMVFMDANSGELPELDAFLSEWGIAFRQEHVRDYENTLSVDGTELIAEYVTEGTGASLTSSLRELETIPKTVVKNAKPIDILYENKTYGNSVRMPSVILQTSSNKTAEAVSLTDNSAAPVKGIYNLMTITVDQRYIDNEAHYSYVLAAGTSTFADDKYIGSRAYGNRDIIFNAMKNFGKKTVPLDLDFKVFESTELSISKGDANRWTVVCTLVLPVIIAGVGIYVYARRRYL